MKKRNKQSRLARVRRDLVEITRYRSLVNDGNDEVLYLLPDGSQLWGSNDRGPIVRVYRSRERMRQHRERQRAHRREPIQWVPSTVNVTSAGTVTITRSTIGDTGLDPADA